MGKKRPSAGEPRHEATRESTREATVSALRPGSGSKRSTARIITIYGPPKTRKTTSVSRLVEKRTKWLLSDPNAVPTLQSLDRMPADEDIYEVGSLEEAAELANEMLRICNEQGPEALGIDFLVVDSLTQFSDWHQRKVAEETGQRFMGDAGNGTGWQQFNAEFGNFVDGLVSLSRFGISVVFVAHSKDKLPKGKGEWAVLNLPPQMATKVARLSNWILFKRFEELIPEGDEEPAESDTVSVLEVGGKKLYFFDSLRTMPLEGWTASVNSLKLAPDEPGDLVKLLEKDGLL
jgi:hypothetical protein